VTDNGYVVGEALAGLGGRACYIVVRSGLIVDWRGEVY